MAFNYIPFNENTQLGRKCRSMLLANESADDQMADVRDTLIQMREGDGSQDAHYTEIAKRGGFGDYDVTTGGAPSALALSKARAFFEELDSAYSKTSGNGSVTNSRAARDQLYSKTR